MATVLWDKLYPYIHPYVPGCPEIVMESHLQEADWLIKSLQHRGEIVRDNIEIEIGQDDILHLGNFL